MGSSGQRYSQNLAGDVGVFMLDPDGGDALPTRGWRGRELFVGHWEATPNAIAGAFALELGVLVEVHAVVEVPERTWVVLRVGTRYSQRDE